MSALTRKTTALLVAGSLALAPAGRAGDLNQEINAMFNNLGTVGNYTEPGAFRGQAMNTYSGGSLTMRAPNKRYQLYAVDPPNFKGSCNGIDIHMGSFSLINSAALKDMLAKVTSALPGLAFQLAVDAVSPLFGDKIKYFKDLESKYTLASKSSCEMATALVSGAAAMTGFSTDKACQSLAGTLGIASDAAESEEKCRTAKSDILKEGENSADPAIKKIAAFKGNLTWAGLLRYEALTNEEREMIMSMIGTVIYGDDYAQASAAAPTIEKISTLLDGNEAQPGATEGKVSVLLLRCKNGEFTQCAKVVEEPIEIETFNTKVRNLMYSIENKILNRENFGTSSAEVAFVNQVTEPVYRMLAIATRSKDRSAAVSLINRYTPLVAADYAYTLVDRSVRIGLQSLSSGKLTLDQAQRADLDAMRDRTMQKLVLLSQERVNLYHASQSVGSMTQELETLARNLRGNSNAFMVLGRLGYDSTHLQ